MKLFHVPRLENETLAEYSDRVAGMEWQFSGENKTITIVGTMVTVDGDAPEGSGLEGSEVVVQAPTPVTVPKTHAQVWEAIKEHRDRLQVGGVKYGVHWYHNDVKSRGQWERMCNRCTKQGLSGTDPYVLNGEQVLWKAMNNQFVPLTAELIFAVVDAMESQEAKIFKAAEIHRLTMAYMSDPTPYDFSGGWPEVYPY